MRVNICGVESDRYTFDEVVEAIAHHALSNGTPEYVVRPGEVYNLGGGRENSVSILEAFDIVENLTRKKVHWTYVDQNRIGDHICYISELRKLKAHFPEWQITRSLSNILGEIVAAEQERYAKV